MSPTQHFFLSSRCVKIETKTAASTNLQGVWPTTLFDNMQVIECLIRAWAGFNRFVDQWTFPRAMREGKSRVGTQSSCALRNSSSLVSYAAIFVAIFKQYDDTKKLHKWILPPYLFSCPLQILFLLPDWTEPMSGIQEKMSTCIERNSLQQNNVHMRLNYKATFKCNIICTKIDNKSFNLTQFRPFKVPTASVLASGRPFLVYTK